MCQAQIYGNENDVRALKNACKTSDQKQDEGNCLARYWARH